MEKDEGQYKHLSRKLIDMALGDKVKIKDIKGVDDKKISVGSGGEKVESNLSIQQKFFNVSSSIFTIFFVVFGAVIPLAVFASLSSITIYNTVKEAGISNIRGWIDPVVKMLNYSYLISLLCVAAIAVLIILSVAFMALIKTAFDGIEYTMLRRSIRRKHAAIAGKLKKMDQEEDRLRNASQSSVISSVPEEFPHVPKW
jgi:hypothetical protein